MNTKLKLTFFFLVFGLFFLFFMNSCQKKGCSDRFALNYTTGVEKDDGSCIYVSDKLTGTWNVTKTFQGNTLNYSATVSKNETNDIDHIIIASSQLNYSYCVVNWDAKTLEFGTMFDNGTITNENDFEINVMEFSPNGGPPIGYGNHHFTR